MENEHFSLPENMQPPKGTLEECKEEKENAMNNTRTELDALKNECQLNEVGIGEKMEKALEGGSIEELKLLLAQANEKTAKAIIESEKPFSFSVVAPGGAMLGATTLGQMQALEDMSIRSYVRGLYGPSSAAGTFAYYSVGNEHFDAGSNIWKAGVAEKEFMDNGPLDLVVRLAKRKFLRAKSRMKVAAVLTLDTAREIKISEASKVNILTEAYKEIDSEFNKNPALGVNYLIDTLFSNDIVDEEGSVIGVDLKVRAAVESGIKITLPVRDRETGEAAYFTTDKNMTGENVHYNDILPAASSGVSIR